MSTPTTPQDTPQGSSPQDITPQADTFTSVVGTFLGVLFRPAAFFRAMTPTGPITLPLAYLVFIYFLAGMIQLVLGMAGIGPAPGGQHDLMRVATAVLIFVPLTFLPAVVLSFVWQMLGSPWGFRTAFRCVAAVMTIFPLVVLLEISPLLGKVLAMAWNFFLLIQASIHVHQLPPRRAWLVFGVLGLCVMAMSLYSTLRPFQP